MGVQHGSIVSRHHILQLQMLLPDYMLFQGWEFFGFQWSLPSPNVSTDLNFPFRDGSKILVNWLQIRNQTTDKTKSWELNVKFMVLEVKITVKKRMRPQFSLKKFRAVTFISSGVSKLVENVGYFQHFSKYNDLKAGQERKSWILVRWSSSRSRISSILCTSDGYNKRIVESNSFQRK